MSDEKKAQQKPFGLTQLEIERIQEVLDTNVYQPYDLAEQWGISKSAADMCFARIRAKMGVHTLHQVLVLAQRVGAVTMTYDAGRGDANRRVVSLDDEVKKEDG